MGGTSDGPDQGVGTDGGYASRDLVADDLRILIGLRSRNAIRDRELTNLYLLLPPEETTHADARYAALQLLIETGLLLMSDGDHKRAATALLSFDTGRWRPLKIRGSEAAANFGLGWDAYRRRRDSTGVSLLMDTLTELADRLADRAEPTHGTAAAPDVVPVAIGDPREAISEEPTTRRSERVWPRPVVAALLACLVAIGIWAVALNGPGADVAGDEVNCGNLVEVPGATAEGAPDDIARWSDRFAAAATELPARLTGCASLMSVTEGVVHQTLSAGIGQPVSVLVADQADPADGDVIALDQAEFEAYRSASWDEHHPNRHIGAPVRRSDVDDGPRVVEFTKGVIVQEHPDAPAFSVAQAIWTKWQSEGGLDGRLGAPVDFRYDRAGEAQVQEFIGGSIEIDFRTGAIAVVEANESEQEIPEIGRGAVVVTRGVRTAWFVDRDGVRHWLPTSDDYGCAVDHHDAKVVEDVPAARLTELPVGEPFTCR